MWNASVNYPNEHKETIKRALPYLKRTVFFHWKFPPTFKVRPYDEEEFALHINYDHPIKDQKTLDNETMHGHEALDLAQAFIDGLLFSLKHPKKKA